MNTRFTTDGSEALEARLSLLIEKVRAGVEEIVGINRLEALVLGGGYGRGEGGVLCTAQGDQPYNDLEFYVFTRGNRLLDERRFRKQLEKLGERLSTDAGLHVEFKIDSLKRLQSSRVSMFSYDLVSKHRMICGAEDLFASSAHHKNSSAIPLSEATRLLFNRCTGLLMVRELLGSASLNDHNADFAGRNIAKAQLALGDAALTVFGKYHWSCRERYERLRLLDSAAVPELPALIEHHHQGVAFKLHPRRVRQTSVEFERQHGAISGLAERIWMWVEAKRLNQDFVSPIEYALHTGQKCPEQNPWKNYLLSLRTFGAGAALDPRACRYPRERLFNSLPLLLWNDQGSRAPNLRRHLQKQLRSSATDWMGLVGAYKQVWAIYG